MESPMPKPRDAFREVFQTGGCLRKGESKVTAVNTIVVSGQQRCAKIRALWQTS